MSVTEYLVMAGPAGYLPPAAASMGAVLPGKGEALVEGKIVPEESAMQKIQKALTVKNPVFFPGPLILWAWKEGVAEKASAVKELAGAVGAKLIPMPDYRPKYPMIDPAVEINPNHPNLTFWHNNRCLFFSRSALPLCQPGPEDYQGRHPLLHHRPVWRNGT